MWKKSQVAGHIGSCPALFISIIFLVGIFNGKYRECFPEMNLYALEHPGSFRIILPILNIEACPIFDLRLGFP
jgi:hypothetical protein